METIKTILPFFLLLLIIASFLGNYIYKVLSEQRHFMLPVLGWVEKKIYKVSSVDAEQLMNWKTYGLALILFNMLGYILLFVILVTQQWMPFNPQGMKAMQWYTVLNTAISFVTNTNWQSYGGETGAGLQGRQLGRSVISG